MSLSCQFAVTAWDLSSPAALAGLPQQAKRAEAMGFEGFWLPEHHFQGGASLSAPLILLAACASATETIDLATTSLLLPIRQAIALAEETATLDLITNGRLILGLGRGFDDQLFEVFGIDPKQKRKRFKHTLEAMMHAWQGGQLLEGTDATLSPRPIQKPHPRLWIAAFGPLALKQAAAFQCPYLASPMETLNQLQTNRQIYTEALAELGFEPPAITPIMRTVFITDDDKKAKAITDRASPAASDGPPSNSPVWVGPQSLIIDRINEYQETLGMNYLIARGRIPGVSVKEQLDSHGALLALGKA